MNIPLPDKVVLISYGLSSLASILTTHLILNLKQAGTPHLESTINTLPEPVFAVNSFVGNLGAPLQVGEEDMEEEGHEEIELEEIQQEGEEQEPQQQICINHEEPGADLIHV